jgi:hypothetical protein
VCVSDFRLCVCVCGRTAPGGVRDRGGLLGKGRGTGVGVCVCVLGGGEGVGVCVGGWV